MEFHTFRSLSRFTILVSKVGNSLFKIVNGKFGKT